MQQSDHGCDNATLLYKPDLTFENRSRIIVKTYNKSSFHLKPLTLKLFHRCKEITLPVMVFSTFNQTAFLRRFNAYKYFFKTGPGHQFNELVIIGKVNRYLSNKAERISFFLLPVYDFRQEFILQQHSIADKVIIHDE